MNGDRTYDPAHARWLNRDPIGEAGGVNLYGYVGGNPASLIDPLGLMCWSDFSAGEAGESDANFALSKNPTLAAVAALAPLAVLALPEFAAGLEEASFFDGASYTSKVLQQIEGGVGEFHSFPEAVTAFEDSGTVSSIVGGDGSTYEMLEIPGSYQTSGTAGIPGSGQWIDGVFQFIKDSSGAINHRLFVPF